MSKEQIEQEYMNDPETRMVVNEARDIPVGHRRILIVLMALPMLCSFMWTAVKAGWNGWRAGISLVWKSHDNRG